ncbi:hypothetical protein RBE51_19405 [Pseudomonas taiwanensis]|uniref:hypothetical protein n=1 Tax=Pseudomonas taiwanensis TaxID=470150 RepID=UPI0028E05852|nr:hypothetical protein [Pseudomonas taiwanensis]MDT8924958.1 hypothetical protein [Pseudomonas taiwanensis]
MTIHEDVKITKFQGVRRNSNNAKKTHKCRITVEYQGKSYELSLPIYSYSAASAITNGRIWRNKDGNMERIRQAILNGLCQLPALPKS